MTNQAFPFLDPKVNPFMDPKNYGFNGDQSERFASFFNFKNTDDKFVKEAIEFQKKNFETLSELTKTANSNMQAILNRQVELAQKLSEETQALTNDMLSNGRPEEKFTRGVELIKDQMEQQTEALKELADMVYKANDEAAKILKVRLDEALTEMDKTIETVKSATVATTAAQK